MQALQRGKSVHIIFDNISFFFLYRRGSTKPQYTEVVVLFFFVYLGEVSRPVTSAGQAYISGKALTPSYS